jgi:hypothetical protein
MRGVSCHGKVGANNPHREDTHRALQDSRAADGGANSQVPVGL